MGSNRKGDKHERGLINALDGRGWAVMRAPSSGSATDRELPDALAGNGTTFVAVEAKYSSGDPVYLTAEEVKGLIYFSENFGARPRIGVKFPQSGPTTPGYGTEHDTGHRFWHPDDIVTEQGAYRVKEEKWMEGGETFEDLWDLGPKE